MSAEPASELLADAFELQRRVSKQLAAPLLDSYEIVAFIGEGTYGSVWQARDLKTGTLVAIKQLRNQPDQKTRLEARMLAGLDEARGIVALKSVHLDSEPYCYVMEFMAGGTLADLLAERVKLPFREAWRVFRELTEALAYVHELGAVHCDLKPQNVLLDSRGKPRLTDFGQARGQGPRGSSLGTRFYMPPEQARLGAPDPCWDTYALGAIFYQMLTGVKPRFSADVSADRPMSARSSTEVRDELERYAAHVQASPAVVAHREVQGVTAEVAQMIERCLSVEPEQRPKDAAALLKLIERCDRSRRRRPLVILGAIAPALTLLMAGIVVIIGGMAALKSFGRRWVTQILTDNQIVAQTVASELENRFNDRLRAVEQESRDERWKDLPSPLRASDELIQQLTTLYEDHREQRLRRWTIADVKSGTAISFGRMPSGSEELDESKRAKHSAVPSQESAMLSVPHLRNSDKPQNVLWVLSIISPIMVSGDRDVSTRLSADVDYRDFNDAFARLENSAFFQRQVIVANEQGQLLYHDRLAEQTKTNKPVDIPKIELTKASNRFYADTFALPAGAIPTKPAAGEKLEFIQIDPWYPSAKPAEYFVSRTAANLSNGQKLAVFVLHDQEVALAGFVEAERSAAWLGIGLLAVGCTMLVANLWVLRRTLRSEEAHADA
jgi:hypothetical protein